MMIGDHNRPFPTVQISPSWDPFDDPASSSPFATFRRYLPSNEFVGAEFDSFLEDPDSTPVDAYSSCDQFRMFEFKVRRCVRGRSHDWTECPYAHPGEKARRRDPRKFHYSGTPCPEFRRVGECKRGDSCEFAHGVFECWLHPARYRTQPCKDGPECRRRVCFFAHTPEQLRMILPHGCESEHGSPIRHALDSYLTNGSFVASPTSILAPPPDSPPVSPHSPRLGFGSLNSVSELVAAMRNLKVHQTSPHPSWGNHLAGSVLRPGSGSLNPTLPGLCSPMWENRWYEEEEPAMERVESGRGMRAKLYARLSEENSLE